MKNLLIIIFLLFTLFSIFSKEVQITLNNGEVKIIAVPENQEDLEKAFIEMSKAYLNTDLSLILALAKLEESNKQLESSNKTIDNLIDRNNTLFQVLQTRSKYSMLRPFVLVGVDYDIDKQVNGNIGIGICFLNWVDIAIIGYFPDFAIGGQIRVFIRK